ncbi:MAG: lysoplasmalogenase [Ferruginibacter sp.]
MKSMFRKNIFFIFWIIVFLDLIELSLNIPQAHYILKPLLMPILIAAVMLLTIKTSGRKKIIGALFFSFLGDVFLLYESRNPIFFILGLFYFLVTHIFYIAWFMQLGKPGTSTIKRHPYLVIIIALYIVTLLYFLWPGLKDLKIPVIIYACIISSMFYFSLRIPYRVGKTARQLLITGAFCFVVSDSLLAIDKFYQHFPFAPVLIMLTYCLAQYFIVKGFIRSRN